MNYKSRKLRQIKLLLVGIICGLPTMVLLAPPMTYTVINTNETGPGSLNDAITKSNGNNPGVGNRNTINFSVAGVINIITTELPSITQPVLIDGTGAPGWIANTNFAQSGPNTATIVVQINGPGPLLSTTAPLNGFTFARGALACDPGSSGSIIQGLSITNFAVVRGLDSLNNIIGGSGILVQGDDVVIRGNFIGMDINDQLAPNFAAIHVQGAYPLPSPNGMVAANNTIIGDPAKGDACNPYDPAGRNLLVGQYGARGTIKDSGNFTIIRGNTVGLDRSGTKSLMRDARNGIVCVSEGFAPDPTGAIYGGLFPGQGNVVAGNSGNNIQVRGMNMLVQGNYVGVGTDGSSIFAVNPNGIGVFIDSGDFFDAIPSCITIDSNTISGNKYGITVGENNFNLFATFAAGITANFIGTDPTGSFAIPNELDGIWIKFGQGTCIAGNTVSANGRHGIRLCKTQFTNIKSNWIGTNINGDNLGNGGDGVRLGSLGIGVQSFGDVVGGAKSYGQPFPPTFTNAIQFNKGNGIKTQGFVQHASIVGNFITDNGENGILLSKGATNNFIGGFNSPGSLRMIGGLISQGNTVAQGPTPVPSLLGTGNLIENNGGDGIKEIEANANTIQDNFVIGNSGNGIDLINSSNTLVGGTDAGNSVIPQVLGNIVTDNGGAGVAIVQTDCKKAKDNAILSNSIVNNAKDGIEFVKQ